VSGTIKALSDEIIFSLLSECPDHAAELGVDEVNGVPIPAGRLPDFSRDGAMRRAAMVEGWAQRLAVIPRNMDTVQDTLTRRVLGYLLTDGFQSRFLGLNGLSHADHIEPLTHLGGVHVAAVQLLASNVPDNSPGGTEAWLERLAELPRTLVQSTTDLRERRLRGFVAPQIVLIRALADIRQSLSGSLTGDVYHRVLEKRRQYAPQTEESRYFKAAQQLIAQQVRPAYRTLLDELERHLACNREDASASSRPGGEAFYTWRLQAYTTSALLPEQAHVIGREELKRLDAEFRQEFAKLRLSGTRAENFRALAAQNSYVDGPEGRIEAESDIRRWVSESRAATRPLFNLWPRADVVVEPIPNEEEGSQHSHYLPPSARRNGCGLFRVNLAHILAVGKAEAPVHCFHETWPGHHVQLAVAAEAQLCAFRRAVLFRAFLEGWAKYAESLPEEVGLSSPLARISRLRMELYSTATLVMDTGIHALGWTLARARNFFFLETGAPAALTEMVILRSAAQPGELAAYKVGLLKMRHLRSVFAAARGSSFRIRDFHDTVLRNGAIPLTLLDEVIFGNDMSTRNGS